MYSIVLITISILTSILWFRNKKSKFRLDILALVSGSAGLMFLIDNIYSYLEEGVLFTIDVETIVLTTVLVVFTIILWLTILLVKGIKH